MMFPERNDSFDFLSGLDSFKKAYRAEKGLDKVDTSAIDNQAAANFAIGDGEKITLNIAGISKNSGPGANM